MNKMKGWYLSVLASVGFAALLYGPFPALAQTAPPLGVVQQFSVLGNSGVTGSTGAAASSETASASGAVPTPRRQPQARKPAVHVPPVGPSRVTSATRRRSCSRRAFNSASAPSSVGS